MYTTAFHAVAMCSRTAEDKEENKQEHLSVQTRAVPKGSHVGCTRRKQVCGPYGTGTAMAIRVSSIFNPPRFPRTKLGHPS